MLRDRKRYCNPGLFTFYQEPLLIVEGHLQYLYDETGRRYLDLLAGVAVVSCGHSHPRVAARIKEQIDRLQHASTVYLHPNIVELARRLSAKLPEGLEVAYFTNSGSEANELAVAMARLYTGRSDVIGVRTGYHGGSAATMGLTALHTWKFPLPAGGALHHAVCPDPYRSPFSGSPEEIAQQSVEEMRDLIAASTPGEIAAFIAEPIQGVGGVTYGAPNYFESAYQAAREFGGVCISDEVHTGFGRTGRYWGFEHFGVVPDIVTCAKAFGNDMPLGAVITRREIAEVMARRLHFNTFGGNPVAAAAGLAVLEVIDEEGLVENSRKQGAYFKAGLRDLQSRHPILGDVRGEGLMLAAELVSDRKTKKPASRAALQVMESARRHQVLLGRGGLHGNVLRLKPPLCISREDIDYALQVLDIALADIQL